MITKEQALTVDVFHENHDPGAQRIVRWRRNGKTQTWKTRPREFRIPVKYGLRGYSQITEMTAHLVHAEADCSSKGR